MLINFNDCDGAASDALRLLVDYHLTVTRADNSVVDLVLTKVDDETLYGLDPDDAGQVTVKFEDIVSVEL